MIFPVTSIVHLKNKKTGAVYVYESKEYSDKEKQQARNRQIYIVHIPLKINTSTVSD